MPSGSTNTQRPCPSQGSQVAHVCGLLFQASPLRWHSDSSRVSGYRMTMYPETQAQGQLCKISSWMKPPTGWTATTWGWEPRIRFICRMSLRRTGYQCHHQSFSERQRMTYPRQEPVSSPSGPASADSAGTPSPRASLALTSHRRGHTRSLVARSLAMTGSYSSLAGQGLASGQHSTRSGGWVNGIRILLHSQFKTTEQCWAKHLPWNTNLARCYLGAM